MRIPRKICDDNGLDYHVIEKLSPPTELLEFYKRCLGEGFNDFIIENSWAFKNSVLGDRVYLTGTIAPLAKSSFGHSLPEMLANPSFLTTKTHNFSKENKNCTKQWINEVQPFCSKSGISKYDLFFWEHRNARFVANSFQNVDALAYITSIFNCRELIEIWLRVPRKERLDNSLHKLIIENTWPELLEYPINPDSEFGVLRKNASLYYFAVMGKWYLNKIKHSLSKMKYTS